MSPADVPDDIVRLARAANPVQAHVWERALEEAGIRCRVVGEYLYLGELSRADLEIWVRRNDLAQAETVLRQGQKASREGAGQEPRPR